jgi:hypothetical protein
MKTFWITSALFLFIQFSRFLAAEPLYSPSWGFRVDLPEGYRQLPEGDGKNKFAYTSQFGALLDVTVYTGKASLEALAGEIETKLGGKGERNAFNYNGKAALLSSLSFPDKSKRNGRFSGWALYMELAVPAVLPPPAAKRTEGRAPAALQPDARPMLFILSYGPPDETLQSFHLSVLDSVAAGGEDTRIPGPVSAFTWPAGAWKRYPLAGTKEQAWFRENDAQAAQALVDREFSVLKRYAGSPLWKDAWKRFYRAIYRDSFDRLKDAAFILERNWRAEAFRNAPGSRQSEEERELENRSAAARILAEKALGWVQSFKYERDLLGSDFVNLISAAREGRGDCDSRAMLWAVVLEQAGIPSAIMVSREFSHAMGLADIEGEGARFPFKEGNTEYRWMVAETTAKVGIGRIEQKVSEVTKWLGIVF